MRLAGPKDIVNRYHRPPENFKEIEKRARTDPPTEVWMVERATGLTAPEHRLPHRKVGPAQLRWVVRLACQLEHLLAQLV